MISFKTRPLPEGARRLASSHARLENRSLIAVTTNYAQHGTLDIIMPAWVTPHSFVARTGNEPQLQIDIAFVIAIMRQPLAYCARALHPMALGIVHA